MRTALAACIALFAASTCNAQAVGDVLINEFVYDSQVNLPSTADYEYVELFNTTAAAVDVSGWELRDNTGVYVMPSGTRIAAGGYLVVSLSATSAQFSDYWGVTPNLDASPYSSHGIQLANGGDGLALFTAAPGNTCMDYVQYGSGNAVPGAPSYSGTRAVDHPSTDDCALVRVPNGTDGNATAGDPGTEAAATTFKPGPNTPGRANALPEVDAVYPPAVKPATASVGRIPRSTGNPLRIPLRVPQGFDFDAFHAGSGQFNNLVIRARHHNGTPTTSVSVTINGGESTVAAPGLVLPATADLAVPGGTTTHYVPVGLFAITGKAPSQNGTVVIDVACTSNSVTTTFKVDLIMDQPEITTSPTLADILSGQVSNVTMAVSGGLGPFSWSIANNPAWATLNTGTGQVTMSPPVGSAGQHTFDITVTDSSTPAQQDTVQFTVKVVDTLLITTASTLTPIAEGAGPSQTVAVSGGTGPFSFGLTGAPAWLTINPSTGALGGTAPSGSANTYNFTINAADSGNPAQQDSETFTLHVVSNVTIASPATIPAGAETSVYSYTFTAVGGNLPYAWTATGLPAFLGLNPNTGELTGTPTNTDGGSYNFDVTVTDNTAPQQTDTLHVTLVISQLQTVGQGGSGSDGGGCCARGGRGVAAAMSVLLLLLLVRRRAQTE